VASSVCNLRACAWSSDKAEIRSRVVNLVYSSKSFVCRFKLFTGPEKRVRNVLQVISNKVRHPGESCSACGIPKGVGGGARMMLTLLPEVGQSLGGELENVTKDHLKYSVEMFVLL